MKGIALALHRTAPERGQMAAVGLQTLNSKITIKDTEETEFGMHIGEN